MLSAWRRNYVLVLALCALVARAQINPHTQIRWPANCNSANYMTYNFLSNTCINVGPVGASGQVQVNQSGAWAVVPGLTYNFATNTLAAPNISVPGTSTLTLAPGQVTWPPSCSTGVYSPISNTCVAPGTAANAAGNAKDVQINQGGGIFGPATGVTYDGVNGIIAGNVNAALQPMNPYALRSTKTKAGLIALNQGGYPGYTSAAQITIALLGDSTAGYHAAQSICALASSYNGIVGYISGGLSGTTLALGFNCAGGLGAYWTPSYTGGGYITDGSAHPWDFNHFPQGGGSVLPSGATATSSASVLSTRQVVYYTADTSGVTITVNYSTDNGTTWNPLSNSGSFVCSGAVTPGVGGVCDASVSLASIKLQILAGGTGTLYVWTAGQINTTANGVVLASLGRGGSAFPDQFIASDAVVKPWYANIHPDLVTMEWKHNPTTAPGSQNGCDYSISTAPGTFQPWSYWLGKFYSQWTPNNLLMDIAYFGSYQSGADGAGCDVTQNNQARTWVASLSPKETYLDLWSQATNAQMQTLGWIDTSVHQSALGQIATGDYGVQLLGIPSWTAAANGKDVQNKITSSSVFQLGGALGAKDGTGAYANLYVDANLSFPYYWRFHSQRGLQFWDQTASTAWAQLCNPTNTSCINSDKSYLPPFQINSASNAAGPWLVGPQATLAGVYTTAGGTTPLNWQASNVFYGQSNATASSATPTWDASQYYFYQAPTVNVTAQVYNNQSVNPSSNVFTIFQPNPPITWTWHNNSSYGPKNAFRVPSIAGAYCSSSMKGIAGQGTQIPVSAAVCTIGSFIGQGENKQVVVADALATGASINLDGAGELNFSAATTASYNFEVTTYSVHPECWATPQFDVGAGNYFWITYTGTAQTQMTMTINFKTAVTGLVSYGCVIRT